MSNLYSAAIEALEGKLRTKLCGLDDFEDKPFLAAIRLLEAAGKVDKKDAVMALAFMKLTEQCWAVKLRKSGAWDSSQIDRGKEFIRSLLSALPDPADGGEGKAKEPK